VTLLWFWLHRYEHGLSMERLYRAAHLSRQSFHEWLDRKMKQQGICNQLLPLVKEIRKEHPGMSSRVMYSMIQPEGIGRDRFIEWCNQEGFKLEQKRSPYRTTNSLGVTRFENKIKDLEVRGANQVWVSDITYYRLGERFYFLTFIMDQYSKKIIGYNTSKSLATESTTIPALEMALKEYLSTGRLILHSDGGGQYYSKDFRNITEKHKIVNSMTEDLAENNHAERLNGTIKNQYLSYYMPTSFSQLNSEVKRAVNNYNQTRPHKSLQMQVPSDVHRQSIKLMLTKK
jgi:transposase InsO family protein